MGVELTGHWLVTGGAGYIGAHVVRALAEAGIPSVVVDDLSTGSRARVPADVPFVQGSVLDSALVEEVLGQYDVAGVVHLAGRKSVAESEARPGWYYQENVGGMRALLQACRLAGVARVVFSSSAAVYGRSCADGITEQAPLLPQSVYGETKLFAELLLHQEARARPMSWFALRYFNVAGADCPQLRDAGEVNLPGIVIAAARRGESVPVFGYDLETRDGSCVRDYIHVVDLAEAHVAAVLRCLRPEPAAGPLNIGTGRGTTVLELLDAFQDHLGVPVRRELCARRPFDPPVVTADVARARAELEWTARRDLGDLVSSAVTRWVG